MFIKPDSRLFRLLRGRKHRASSLIYLEVFGGAGAIAGPAGADGAVFDVRRSRLENVHYRTLIEP